MGFRSFHRLAVPVVVAIVVLASHSVSGQTKTGWGDPDLQGIWTSSGATPFERPSDLADRETLSTEEVASARSQAEERSQELLQRAAQRTQAGGNIGAYNADESYVDGR